MSPQKPSRRSALFALLLGLTVGLLSAELILRAADRLGWISIWEDARTARQSSIWMASVNDIRPSDQPSRWFLERPFYLADLADLLGQLFDRRFQRGYTPASYWERLYRDDTDGWSSALEGFRYISEFATSRQVPALVVIFPALSREGWWSGDARGRHAKVASAARAAGLEVLDLLPVYARHPVDALRSHPMDTFHPNSVGHRIAARALAAKLGPMLRRGSSSPG